MSALILLHFQLSNKDLKRKGEFELKVWDDQNLKWMHDIMMMKIEESMTSLTESDCHTQLVLKPIG